tara:strand:+ start:11056 stop:11703 length:648 start_codon:yes stop_codon:yes gene_type:complete
MYDKYSYTYILVLLLATIFYFLKFIDKKSILSLIIILIIGYILYNQIINKENNDAKNKLSFQDKIDDKILNLDKSLSSNIYDLNILPKKLKYISNDEILVSIIKNLYFLEKINKTRYAELLTNLDKLMNIYIFILNDIYDVKYYIKNFIDIRDNIIALLQSYLNFTNLNKKHYDIVNKNLHFFIFRSRKMISILENYAKYEKKIFHLDDTIIKPY